MVPERKEINEVNLTISPAFRLKELSRLHTGRRNPRNARDIFEIRNQISELR